MNVIVKTPLHRSKYQILLQDRASKNASNPEKQAAKEATEDGGTALERRRATKTLHPKWQLMRFPLGGSANQTTTTMGHSRQ
jgi:hypothetical protein